MNQDSSVTAPNPPAEDGKNAENPSRSIAPTVGRVVHFYRAHEDTEGLFEGPLAALVTAVHADKPCVNLAVFNYDGALKPETDVPLIQPDAGVPFDHSYCCWMPYQVKKNYGSESGEPAAGTEVIGGGEESGSNVGE